MKVGKVIDGYYNYIAAAERNKSTFGITPELKFFDPKLNEIFCGGLSKPNATNIILIYGTSGVGKSLFSLNVLASAVREKKKWAHILLEDDAEESLARFSEIIPIEDICSSEHILISGKDIEEHFDQREALELFEDMYKNYDVDVIVLDHIQFLFEATATSMENEWIRQRTFVQELNRIVKKYKKTIVLISHVKKGADMSLDSTTGSNAIPQVATKAIAIYRDEDKQLCLRQEKSRYTKPYFEKIPIRFKNFRLEYNDNINEDKVEEEL